MAAGSEIAVAAKIEPEDARRLAEERAVLDEVGDDRAGPAVQEQDRLARIRPPGVCVAVVDRRLRGQPATREAKSVPRSQADDLTAEGIDGRTEGGLVRGHSLAREQPIRAAPEGEAGDGRRQGQESADDRRPPDQRSAAGGSPPPLPAMLLPI